MTDRELLELAAKAAGIPLHELDDTYGDCGGIEKDGWNPLTDDGDALRLAVSLKMEVYHGWDGGHSAYASVPQEDSRPVFCVEPHIKKWLEKQFPESISHGVNHILAEYMAKHTKGGGNANDD